MNGNMIGQRLRMAIEDTPGLSQDRLGREIGHTRGGYIHRLMNGQIENPGIETISKIAHVISRFRADHEPIYYECFLLGLPRNSGGTSL